MRHLAIVATSLVILAAGCGGSKSKHSNSAATAAGTTSGSTAGTTSGTTGATGSGSTSTGGVVLTAVAPQSGPVDGGTAVTITGSGFQAQGAGETFVLFGAAAVRVTPTSDTQILVNAPATTQAGQVDLRVVNELGQAKLVGGWTYDPRAASLAFEPAVGHYEVGQAGTRITLKVKNFGAALSAAAVVRFGTTPATVVEALDAETLRAEVPSGLAAGLVDVTVEEGGKTVTQPGFRVQGALAYGDLVVNEILYNPGGIDANRDGVIQQSADEFVEIVNTTNQPIDLSYLTVRDGINEQHRFPNPTTLPPGGAIVVFGAGTPFGFAGAHQSGQGQSAVNALLGLNNTGTESVEIRTLPGANLSGVGTTLFLVTFTSTTANAGISLQNKTDGQRITANPADAATYFENHNTAAGAVGAASPGVKKDGTKF